ncbi:hypothetical protein [Ferrimonas balearica]|uniref:hypothetical protein n=1 Tax=Ferrimonas balearica TaxID=44012 RepID=UPI001C99C68A|nr:hypothetical protein [Ferrimonas balearica]MBY5992424.1 hypothetical protein [Ferrimonas balearica]
MRNLYLTLALVSLAGCGGSSSDDGPEDNRPDGFNTFESGAGIHIGVIGDEDYSDTTYFGLGMFAPDGTMVSFSLDQNNDANIRFTDHKGAGTDGFFDAEGRVYDCLNAGACQWHNSTLNGTLNWDVLASNMEWASEAEPMMMTRDGEASFMVYPLSTLAGEFSNGYITLTLAESGELSGWDIDGCNWAGTLAPYEDLNLFALNLTSSNCDFADRFAGLAFVMEDDEEGHILWGLTSSETAFLPLAVWDGETASAASYERPQANRATFALRTLATQGPIRR